MAAWAAFLIVYWFLDRADAALSAGPLQPAPWDLSGGLAFAFLVLEGPWLAPLAAVAEFISARAAPGSHAPLAADVASAAVLAAT
ncbi:MAG TPA: hypothetical protein VF459_11090, partial [Caulobacteraceae bacterium]